MLSTMITIRRKNVTKIEQNNASFDVSKVLTLMDDVRGHRTILQWRRQSFLIRWERWYRSKYDLFFYLVCGAR